MGPFTVKQLSPAYQDKQSNTGNREARTKLLSLICFSFSEVYAREVSALAQTVKLKASNHDLTSNLKMELNLPLRKGERLLKQTKKTKISIVLSNFFSTVDFSYFG